MTNEIATRSDDIDLAALPAGMAQLVQYEQVLASADAYARRLAKMQIAGKYREKPEDALGAILYGAELGLNPIQSLQQVFTVHGTPSIYTRTMVALLKRKGFKFRTVECTDESVTVTAAAPDGSTESSTWTISRAITAGYVPEWDDRTNDWKKNQYGKLDGNMKYLTDPQTMLWAKAAAEVSRRIAPDVLLGIAYTAEDLESDRDLVRVGSERVDQSAPVSAADILGDDNEVRDDESVAAALAADAAEHPAPDPEPADHTDHVHAAEPAAGDPPPAMATAEQISTLGSLLQRLGKRTRKAQLDEINRAFSDRTISAPTDLTAAEIDSYNAYLTKELGDSEQTTNGADQ
jgi:hypothetical protein